MRGVCRIHLVVLMCGLWAGCGAALAGEQITLSRAGHALSAIVIAPNASASERYAADVLKSYLQQITGAPFAIHTDGQWDQSQPIIAVGPGAASHIVPDLDLTAASLGDEGIIMRTDGGNLILSGAKGAARGTIYAVYTFLGRIGCRWWSPRDRLIPSIPELGVGALNVRYHPPLEYRQVYTIDATNADWAVANRINGEAAAIPPEKGGHIIYAGTPPYFVHTFDMLVPHEKYFAAHPDWFSQIDGKRVAPPAPTQLCLTNPQLLEFVKGQVRKIAAAVPRNTKAIISVSQNDNSAACQCDRCQKLTAEEGSPAGPLLHFVNAIADDIRTDYPNITIDTLAYRYTRRPPRHVKPRDNVIVRLCSIECSFAQPITAPINRAFAEDVRGWSKISRRLYIWDYVTNFLHYVHPHPNLRVLGPNVRFFVENGAKGIFEQGNYQSVGGDFAVLKQWVLAQLLWNPSLDDRALIQQFIDEYFQGASKEVARYIDLRSSAARNSFVGISDGYASSWLTPELLVQCYDLLQDAKSRVAGNATLSRRVDLLTAPVLEAVVLNWDRKQAWENRGASWPLTRTREYYADQLSRIIREQGITAVSEGRTEGDLQSWIKSLGVEYPVAPPPPQVAGLARSDWHDLQDHNFILANEGVWATRIKDARASDGSAVAMPGDHVQWAIQARVDPLTFEGGADEPWTVYASIRVEADGRSGDAFSCGVYDNATSAAAVKGLTVRLSQITDNEYHLYRIGAAPLGQSKIVWIAPKGNKQVKRILVDRLLLIRGNVTLDSSRVR